MDIANLKQISMLSIPVLEKLQSLAAKSGGPILEIGSYIGGSTIAMTSGHSGQRVHAVIDTGGSYEEHDEIPSSDIIRDWQENMTRFGQRGRAKIFKGYSMEYATHDAALKHIDHDIDLFF